jgi:peptidoglycan LD-endopeptidase CwlK
MPTKDQIPVLQDLLQGTTAPEALQKHLVIVEMRYYDFRYRSQKGTLIVLDSVALEVKAIFEAIYAAKFPIKKVVPLSFYDWSEQKSLLDNNTSSFNYRSLEGFPNLLSWHALGLAIDINPLQNPATMPNAGGGVYKTPGNYDQKALGTILPSSPVVRAFRKYGWQWGGNYLGKKDYQHFEKPLKDEKRLQRLLEG